MANTALDAAIAKPADRTTENPAAAAADNLRPHTVSPADVNAAQANATEAANAALVKQFGAPTFTDEAQTRLCDKLGTAPRDARSNSVERATVSAQQFNWDKDGVGAALSVSTKVDANGKQHADACVLYPNGTKIGVSGTFENAVPGGIPIKADNITVLSNGGKLEFKPTTDGKAMMSMTDPKYNTQDIKFDGPMLGALQMTTGKKNFQMLFGEPSQKGLTFAFTSDADSPARKATIDQWKARNNVK